MTEVGQLQMKLGELRTRFYAMPVRSEERFKLELEVLRLREEILLAEEREEDFRQREMRR
jgi:hypothetical protein